MFGSGGGFGQRWDWAWGGALTAYCLFSSSFGFCSCEGLPALKFDVRYRGYCKELFRQLVLVGPPLLGHPHSSHGAL